jgi:hypothetical protein
MMVTPRHTEYIARERAAELIRAAEQARLARQLGGDRAGVLTALAGRLASFLSGHMPRPRRARAPRPLAKGA